MNQVALTDTYMDVENLIYKIVWRFKNLYGGDVDELKSLANLAFMESYTDHDEERSSFSNWIAKKVWYALLGNLRKDCRQERCLSTATDSLKQKSSFFQDHFLMRLKDGLSMDAKEVINLAVSFPEDVRNLAIQEDATYMNLRKAIKQYLRNCGWTFAQIKTGFKEVKAALHGC